MSFLICRADSKVIFPELEAFALSEKPSAGFVLDRRILGLVTLDDLFSDLPPPSDCLFLWDPQADSVWIYSAQKAFQHTVDAQ